MKKIVILVVALAVLGGLGWYISTLFETKGKSDTELIDFAIKDVESIDRVIITDKTNRSFEIQRKGRTWLDKDGNCVVPEIVTNLLDAFKNIEFKGYLPDNSHKNYNTMMAAQNIKVEIFQNGEWTKTWYLGPTSPDHYSQIMLLDSKEYGKSTHPVQMKVKGMNGILEPRFFADPRLWACTDIFKLPLDRIARVDVNYVGEKARSFTVTKKGPEMKVYQSGNLLSNVEDRMIFSYLQNYKKIHYNLRNFELTQKQVDSLKRTTPFAILTVQETNGTTTKLRCFKRKLPTNEIVAGQEVINSDRDNFWCELPGGDVVKCQYHVFNALFFGHIYFPMDQSKFTTYDGIVPLDSPYYDE